MHLYKIKWKPHWKWINTVRKEKLATIIYVTALDHSQNWYLSHSLIGVGLYIGTVKILFWRRRVSVGVASAGKYVESLTNPMI